MEVLSISITIDLNMIMKRIFCTLPIILLLITACSSKGDIKVISLNIRYDNPGDGINRWDARKEFLAGWIISRDPDLLGLQEALWHQYSYIDSCLSDSYLSIAAGRDDGLKSGEMVPVFFKRDRFRLEDSGTFWLSETPTVAGSKGPGAVLPRIVTWGRLYDKNEGKKVFFFNTHFSHMSDSARMLSSELLRTKIAEIGGDGFMVLTGDFNMGPGSKAYAVLTGGEGKVADTRQLSATDPEGPHYSYNGFSDRAEGTIIDHIFTNPGNMVSRHIIHTVKEEELFISDHWPVEVIISVK